MEQESSKTNQTKEISKQQKMPIGIIIILVLVILTLVNLLFSLSRPTIQFGPRLLTGGSALIANLILIVIYGLIIFGIIKRYKWAWKLILGFYTLYLILGLVNLIFSLSSTGINLYGSFQQSTLLLPIEAIRGFVIFALVSGLAIGIVIIVYIFKKKDYFTN